MKAPSFPHLFQNNIVVDTDAKMVTGLVASKHSRNLSSESGGTAGTASLRSFDGSASWETSLSFSDDDSSIESQTELHGSIHLQDDDKSDESMAKPTQQRKLSWGDVPAQRPRLNSTPSVSAPKSILKKSSFLQRAVSEGSVRRRRTSPKPRQQSLDNGSLVNDLPLLHSMLRSRQVKYGNTDYRVSVCWNHIGNHHFRNQNFQKALAAYQNSVFCYETNKDHTGTESIAAAYSNMGTIYWTTGDFPNAISVLKKSIEIHQDVGDAGSSFHIANSLYQIGLALSLQRDYEGAMSALADCRFIRERNLKSGQNITPNQVMDLARVADAIGKLNFFQGRYEEAMDCHQEALAMKRRAVGDTHSSVVTSMINIGSAHKALGNYDESVFTFLVVLGQQKAEFAACKQNKQTRKNEPRVATEIAETMEKIANLQTLQGCSSNAKISIKEAIKYYERAGLKKNDPKIVGLKWMTC